MARIAARCDTYPAGGGGAYYLELDGRRGVVMYGVGVVFVMNGSSGFDAFPLPKRTRGAASARLIYDAVVRPDRSRAERVARFESDLAKKELLRLRDAEVKSGCVAMQARFDSILSCRSVSGGASVMFHVTGGDRSSSSVPSHVPEKASVRVSLEATPEEASRLVDTLIRGGFLRGEARGG